MRDPSGRNRERANALWAKGIDVVALDVTDDTSVEKGVQRVLAKAGRIDVLVNNAGMASVGVSEAFTADQLRAMFETNVIGVFRTARAVLPSMRRERDGLIVNIGSILGRVTFPFFGLYGASKFAVEAINDTLRYEVSQFGVEVVLLQPSAYPTSMYLERTGSHRRDAHRVLRRRRRDPRRDVPALHERVPSGRCPQPPRGSDRTPHAHRNGERRATSEGGGWRALRRR